MKKQQSIWWEEQREELLILANKKTPLYVYSETKIRAAARQLKKLSQIDRVFYAIKANDHPEVLKTVVEEGLNLECVSQQELAYIIELFPDLPRDRILFTPNFAPRSEYEYGLAQGVHITIDSLYPLQQWSEIFEGKDIFIRIDPGQGRGHHEYVYTAGKQTKFGIPLFELEEVAKIIQARNIRIVGLHAHVGSGVFEPDNWFQIGCTLTEIAKKFPDVQYIDLGGGLGVIEKLGQSPLDLFAVDDTLRPLKKDFPHIELWIEPGRFVVCEAGVLLAKVTQIKGKDTVRYIGVDVGMNTLIRPALYQAYHHLVNLSRLTEEASGLATIVGPICESADKFGVDRPLPNCTEGDVILIAGTGAYGRVMSSYYNRRPPAEEIFLKQTRDNT